MTGKQWNAEFFSDIGDPSQLAPLFDSLPEVFFFAKDLQGRFTAINNPLLRMIGVAREEVLGATDYDFFDRDLADAYRSEDMTVMETGEPVLNELWWVPNIKTGDIHWYYSSKICLRSIDERAIGIAGIMRPLGNVGELTSDFRQMSSVASYIETHYAERLTVENMAEVAQCSPRHFQRVFKRVFKTSALEHLMRSQRLNLFQNILERPIPPPAIPHSTLWCI